MKPATSRKTRLRGAEDDDKELSDNVEFEGEELAEIYAKRGVEPTLARQVAQFALLGAIGARAGGANVLRGTERVTFWGVLAMALRSRSCCRIRGICVARLFARQQSVLDVNDPVGEAE